MLVRAIGFSKAHPSTDASYTAVVARLDEAITHIRALELQERDGHTHELAALARRRLQRRGITTSLQHLVRVARVVARDNPALLGEFRLVESHAPNRVFVNAAQALLAAAQAQKDALVGAGLGETFLDGLAEAVGQFDADTSTSHDGRAAHVGASSDLKAVIRECMLDVAILDGLNRVRFADDPELLAAWESARNVAGPFQRNSTPEPAPSPAPDPAPPGDRPTGGSIEVTS